MSDIKIAVLLTCHNRLQKTERCLVSLKNAYSRYKEDKLVLEIFLTDDGCTDGTPEAARRLFPDKHELHILTGNGDLFWAGGMRHCWKEAMRWHDQWNYYLLLNDDVQLMDNVFDELLAGMSFCEKTFGQKGMISGITCDIEDDNLVTYGGSVWKNKMLSTFHMLSPTGKPQLCDLPNANILLISKEVVDRIGIFYDGYQHGIADYDYGVVARKNGIPVLVTSNYCGKCEHDHADFYADAQKITRMSLKERKAYFDNPIHSSKDYYVFVKRTSPLRSPLVFLGRLLNLYAPKFYYHMSGMRNQDFRK